MEYKNMTTEELEIAYNQAMDKWLDLCVECASISKPKPTTFEALRDEYYENVKKLNNNK